MVKTYSELYREARKALVPIDGPHQAGVTARELLQFVSGKTAAQLLADGDKYADSSVCDALDRCLERMASSYSFAPHLAQTRTLVSPSISTLTRTPLSQLGQYRATLEA